MTYEPFAADDKTFQWYRGPRAAANDRSPGGDEYWLPPGLFDRLKAGRFQPLLGIRIYESKESALSDLRNAGV